MSWSTDDGKHEAWTAPTFADGALGTGANAYGISVSRLAGGTILDYGQWQTRAATEVIGWVCACECGWRGPLWKRVATESEHDIERRRIYSADGWEDEALDDACWAEWKEHIAPHLALAEVAELAARRAQIEHQLHEAVDRAKAAGATAEDLRRAERGWWS